MAISLYQVAIISLGLLVSAYTVLCDDDPCQSAPCLNGGSCLSFLPSYVCRCASPFVGTNCQTKVSDPCQSNPCQNGGVCRAVNNYSGYQCDCPYLRFGDNCQIIADPCLSQPCFNNGTCVASAILTLANNASTFVCRCAYPYVGDRCNINQNTAGPCAKSPCGLGTCVATTDKTHICVCPGRYRISFTTC